MPPSILVVARDPCTRLLFEEGLEARSLAGWTVRSVPGRPEALAALAERAPQVVLIALGCGEGCPLAAEIRKRAPGVAVLAFADEPCTPPALSRARAARVEAVLPTPSSAEALEVILEAHLEYRAASRAR